LFFFPPFFGFFALFLLFPFAFFSDLRFFFFSPFFGFFLSEK